MFVPYFPNKKTLMTKKWKKLVCRFVYMVFRWFWFLLAPGTNLWFPFHKIITTTRANTYIPFSKDGKSLLPACRRVWVKTKTNYIEKWSSRWWQYYMMIMITIVCVHVVVEKVVVKGTTNTVITPIIKNVLVLRRIDFLHIPGLGIYKHTYIDRYTHFW